MGGEVSIIWLLGRSSEKITDVATRGVLDEFRTVLGGVYHNYQEIRVIRPRRTIAKYSKMDRDEFPLSSSVFY